MPDSHLGEPRRPRLFPHGLRWKDPDHLRGVLNLKQTRGRFVDTRDFGERVVLTERPFAHRAECPPHSGRWGPASRWLDCPPPRLCPVLVCRFWVCPLPWSGTGKAHDFGLMNAVVQGPAAALDGRELVLSGLLPVGMTTVGVHAGAWTHRALCRLLPGPGVCMVGLHEEGAPSSSVSTGGERPAGVGDLLPQASCGHTRCEPRMPRSLCGATAAWQHPQVSVTSHSHVPPPNGHPGASTPCLLRTASVCCVPAAPLPGLEPPCTHGPGGKGRV